MHAVDTGCMQLTLARVDARETFSAQQFPDLQAVTALACHKSMCCILGNDFD